MREKTKILVLEDDTKFLEVLVDLLSDHGYDVTPATSGEEAVAKAMETSFDLIIADIRMEGMSGLDAVERSREQQPEIGTLIVSGYATPDNMARAMQLQSGKILVKPFKLKEFLRRVEEQLAIRQKHQASASRTNRSETELLWALSSLVDSLDRPAAGLAAHLYRSLAEGLARSAGLSQDVCFEVGLAAAIASSHSVLVPQEFLDNATSLPTLKYCLTHYDDPPEEAAHNRLEARLVAFALELVGEGWQSEAPPSLAELSRRNLAPDLLELYQQYRSGDESRAEKRSVQEHLRSALSLADTLRELGRVTEARKAFQELRKRSDGRLHLSATLGQAQLEFGDGQWEDMVALTEEALLEARGAGPVAYATTLLACGLLLYQANREAAPILREAIKELGRLRFDGSVALAAIAMADLGHQPNPAKLNYFLSALVQSRYSEEVMGAAGWLVPASFRLLCRLTDKDNIESLLKLLNRLAPGVLAYLRTGRARMEEKGNYLSALEQHASARIPPLVVEELALDHDPAISRRASALKSAQSGFAESSLIRCRSFGIFQVWRGAEMVPDADWKTKKVRYYFAYLASHWGSYQPDDQIIERFWPGKSSEKGKQNLYWATSILRKCLAADDPGLKSLVERREESLRLSPEVQYWHDLQEFESLLHTGGTALRSRDWTKARIHLSQMAELYTGPYLEGYNLEWAETKRDQLHLKFLEGLGFLAQACLELQDFSGALEAAYRLLDLDPTTEAGHEYAMRCFIGRGDYTRAIQQYEHFHKILADEYGLEPGPELLRLYDTAFSYGEG